MLQAKGLECMVGDRELTEANVPGGSSVAGSSHIHSGQAYKPTNAGSNQEHGHKEARGDGTPGCPSSAPKVEHQHHQKRCIAKLPVRAAREQVPDCILACAHDSSISALVGSADARVQELS